MQLFGKEIPHPADTRIVDPPKAPPLPSWVPKDTRPYARADVAEMVLTVIAEVRRPADLDPDAPTSPVATDVRCKGDAKTILALWSYLEHPPIAEFARDLIAVVRAARPGGCPARIFARDIRAEGWEGGEDRHRSLPTLCRRESWERRLEVARDWIEHPERFTAQTPRASTSTRDDRDFASMYQRYRSPQPSAK